MKKLLFIGLLAFVSCKNSQEEIEPEVKVYGWHEINGVKNDITGSSTSTAFGGENISVSLDDGVSGYGVSILSFKGVGVYLIEGNGDITYRNYWKKELGTINITRFDSELISGRIDAKVFNHQDDSTIIIAE